MASLVVHPMITICFKYNNRKGNAFTGGLLCQCQVKELLYFCQWSHTGSIITVILYDILATLDELKIFDRSCGQIPCVLHDGHGSQFGLPFLDRQPRYDLPNKIYYYANDVFCCL